MSSLSPKYQGGTLTVLLAHPATLALAVCLSLTITTVCVYWPVGRYDYVVLDDPQFVYQNAQVLHGLTWQGVKWAFQVGHGDYWHPLTWLSLMLDVTLFGQGAGGLHWTNVLLHACNGMLVFILLRSWTGSLWRSAMVAAFFALHPLRVESVAWITERKDVLSAFFFLLTLWAFGNYARSKNPAPDSRHSTKPALHYAVALLFYACALMSKTMVVTLPCVLLLLDAWPWRRIDLAHLRSQLATVVRLTGEKLPFFLLSGFSIWATSRSQPKETPIFVLSDLNWVVRIETVFITYAQYLARTFWPVRLATYYPHPLQWSGPLIVLSISLVVGSCAVVIWLRRNRPYFFVGWFWFVGMIVPVLGLNHGWFQYIADRFTYLPSIGLFIFLVWVVFDLAMRIRMSERAVAIVLAFGVVACAMRTRDQLHYWRNSELLLKHTLATGERSDLSYEKLSEYLVSKGRTKEAVETYREALDLHTNPLSGATSPFARKSGKSPRYYEAWAHITLGYFLEADRQWDAAIREIRKGLDLVPDIAKGYNLLGRAHAALGKTEEAIDDFRAALRIDPNYFEAHNNFGLILNGQGKVQEALQQYNDALRVEPNAGVYINIGNAFAGEGRESEAKTSYENALQLDPGSAKAHYNLGIALIRSGKIDEAIEHFTEAARLEPGQAEIYNSLGYALALNGRVDQAITNYKRSLQIKPGYLDAHANLGLALMTEGRIDEAIKEFTEVLRIDPNSADTRNSLGLALQRQGLLHEAASQYAQAARIAPNNPEIHFNLGRVLVRLNQTNEAAAELSEALRLKPDFADARRLLQALGTTQLK
jgi:tetratricopeptide (TPR) repeat protein